jgi:hypothetical protein
MGAHLEEQQANGFLPVTLTGAFSGSSVRFAGAHGRGARPMLRGWRVPLQRQLAPWAQLAAAGARCASAWLTREALTLAPAACTGPLHRSHLRLGHRAVPGQLPRPLPAARRAAAAWAAARAARHASYTCHLPAARHAAAAWAAARAARHASYTCHLPAGGARGAFAARSR